ncbi:MAG: hypothetical protein LW701_01805 [Fluviicola sp.]|jgi:hypothetical protein|nr:hypothetical protein [Fluviicola sp.]
MKNKNLLSEIRRMQELAGIITEGNVNENWYSVKKWDDAGQKYVSHLGGNIDGLKEQPKFKVKDVVKIKAYQKEYMAQIIGIFANYDTQEILYGVRIFSDPTIPTSSTSLDKIEEVDIIEKLSEIPDNIKNNPKFEK